MGTRVVGSSGNTNGSVGVLDSPDLGRQRARGLERSLEDDSLTLPPTKSYSFGYNIPSELLSLVQGAEDSGIEIFERYNHNCTTWGAFFRYGRTNYRMQYDISGRILTLYENEEDTKDNSLRRDTDSGDDEFSDTMLVNEIAKLLGLDNMRDVRYSHNCSVLFTIPQNISKPKVCIQHTLFGKVEEIPL